MNKELMQKMIEEKVANHQLTGNKIPIEDPSGQTMDVDVSLVAMFLAELDLMIKASEVDLIALWETREHFRKQIKKANKS